jgi:hypothetical protein
MPMNEPETWEESANEFIERQTREIEEEFGCSRPQPRNRVMGFRGSDKPKRQREFSPKLHDTAPAGRRTDQATGLASC